MKKVIGLSLLAVCLLGISSCKETSSTGLKRENVTVLNSSDSFYQDADRLGFHIEEESWEPIKTPEEANGSFHSKSFEVSQKGIIQYRTTASNVILRNKEYEGVYVFAYRVEVDPLQPGRDWGFLGIGSHGDDWRFASLDTSVQLNGDAQMTRWSQQETLKNGQTKTTIVDNLYALDNYNDEDVDRFSKTKCGVNLFGLSYTAKYEIVKFPYVRVEFGKSLLQRMDYYGFFIFQAENEDFSIDVTHKWTYNGIHYQGNQSGSWNYQY